MIMLIASVTFFTMLILLLAGVAMFTARKRNVQQRLQQFAKQPSGLSEITDAPSIPSGKLSGLRGILRQISKPFESQRWSKLMEHRLIQAGVPMRGSEFLVICLGVAFFLALLLAFMSGGKLIVALGGGVIGWFIPFIILNSKIGRRVKAFNNQLGDCLILVANSLRTGYSFMQSIEMVAREMPKPIAEEFSRVLKEMNLGVTTEQALNNMVKRINSEDLDLVVTAVLIQRQVGGNLAEILDNIAHTIRERVKMKGQIKTLTAQGRISGIIIGALPVVIGCFIYLINPEYMQILFTHPLGKMMLVAGVVSQMIGIMFIRKIVNIEI